MIKYSISVIMVIFHLAFIDDAEEYITNPTLNDYFLSDLWDFIEGVEEKLNNSFMSAHVIQCRDRKLKTAAVWR